MKLALAVSILTFSSAAAELKPATLQAYKTYLAKIEAGLAAQPLDPHPGAIAVDPAAPGNRPTHAVPGGLIHDWRASVLLPGITAARFLAVLQDIDRYPAVYAPDIAAAKLLSKNEDDYRVFLRIRKRNIVTVVLDTEYLVRYRRLADHRWLVDSASTRVSEVESAGTKSEEVLPAGSGYGFLWGIRSWWRLAETPEGLAVELRSVSLSRDLPPGTTWIIGPLITEFPRQSVRDTITKTAAAAR